MTTSNRKSISVILLSSVFIFLFIRVSTSIAQHPLTCLPGDKGCSKCQASCESIPLAHLPECCEAFSTCCPTYSKACGQCSANEAVDPHFPESCCASFTDCCDMIPGLNIVGEFNPKQGSKISSKASRTKGSLKRQRLPTVVSDASADDFPRNRRPSASPFTPQIVNDASSDSFSVPARSNRERLQTLPRQDGRRTGSTKPKLSPSRSRQPAAVRQRSSTDSKVQAAASSNVARKGRVTSRGRIVQ